MAASVGIGLEINEDQIRAVQLRRSGRGALLEAAGASPLPRGTLAGGMVQDVRLLAEGVRRVLRENRMHAVSAVVGIAGRSAGSRVLELPPMRREEMRSVVAGEMEHYRMIPAGQGTFDFVALGGEGPNANGRVRLLLMAADKRIVDSYREGLRLAGLQMIALEPTSLAASRAVFSSLGTGGVAVVAVGAHDTELAVFHGGSLQYSRQIDTGALDMAPASAQAQASVPASTAAAQGAVSTPAVEAVAELGRPDGHLGRPEEEPSATGVSAMGAGSLAALLFEAKRSLDFYHREAPADARVERVLLSIDPGRLPELAAELEETLALPVSLCQPFEGLARSRSGQTEAPAGGAAAAYASATGLALRAIGAVPEAPSLDLSDTGTESRLAKIAPRWLTYALAASIVLVVAAGLTSLFVGRGLQQRRAELAAKRVELARVAALELEKTSAARRAQEAQAIVQLRGLPWSDILFQVAEFVPRGVWVQSLGTEGGNTLALQGQAVSLAAVSGLMDSLTRSALFSLPRMTSVQRASAAGHDIVSYQIKATVNPRPAVPPAAGAGPPAPGTALPGSPAPSGGAR